MLQTKKPKLLLRCYLSFNSPTKKAIVPAVNPPNKMDHSGDIKKNNGPKIAPKITDKVT